MRWKYAVEGKGMRMNDDKRKGMKLIFGKKSSVLKVDMLVVFVVGKHCSLRCM